MTTRVRLQIGQSVYWKRRRIGYTGMDHLSIRRVPATVLRITEGRIQIELGELVSGVDPILWVSRGSLERRVVRSSGKP